MKAERKSKVVKWFIRLIAMIIVLWSVLLFRGVFFNLSIKSWEIELPFMFVSLFQLYVAYKILRKITLQSLRWLFALTCLYCLFLSSFASGYVFKNYLYFKEFGLERLAFSLSSIIAMIVTVVFYRLGYPKIAKIIFPENAQIIVLGPISRLIVAACSFSFFFALSEIQMRFYPPGNNHDLWPTLYIGCILAALLFYWVGTMLFCRKT